MDTTQLYTIKGANKRPEKDCIELAIIYYLF